MRVNLCANGDVCQTWTFGEFAGVPIPSEVYDVQEAASKAVETIGRRLVIASIPVGILSMTQTAFAATAGTVHIAAKLQPLITMVQDLSLPVGIAVSTWGLIEIMIGNPSGKQKIKMSILGYVGIFVVPYVFNAIHDAFAGV